MSEQVKRPTISDVAQHAGVSKAAVSKVLRDAYGVSETMRSRVEASMKTLGYRPSALARGLRGSSFTIGVFIVDLHNTFFSVLIEGIREEAEANGYQLFLGPARQGLTGQRRMIEAMVDRRMDGLVLIAPFGASDELENIARGTPTVVLGRHGPALAYDTVASDDIAGSTLIVDHLVALGHRRIVHVSNVAEGKNEPGMPQEVRARGYLQAMERHGLAPDVIVAPWTHEGGQKAGAEILARRTRPSAVHAGADVAALGLLTEMWSSGVKVPEEVSVAGYDNIFMGSLAPVGLTTVDQSGFEMGATAAKLLLERIQGRKESVSVLVPPRLVVRKTTGPKLG